MSASGLNLELQLIAIPFQWPNARVTAVDVIPITEQAQFQNLYVTII